MIAKNLMVALVGSVLSLGCTVTSVRQNPGEHDKGFRFYRPKPYLMVTPAGGDTGTNAPEFVKLEMKMMPDFSEQYSIHPRAGFGDNTTNLTLDEGWNLTKIDAKLDSKTDENIKSIAGFVKSAAALAPSGARSADTGRKNKNNGAVITARNVPFGVYEAVISCDESGTKRLAGFRYIGFMPNVTCPVNSCGSQTQCCDGEVYGLVNEVIDGKSLTVFKLISDIATEEVKAVRQKAAAAAPEALLTLEKVLSRLKMLNDPTVVTEMNTSLHLKFPLINIVKCTPAVESAAKASVKVKLDQKPAEDKEAIIKEAISTIIKDKATLPAVFIDVTLEY